MFDSGLGGLSVAQELRELEPSIDLHYVADRARSPYGPRPLHVVRRFAEEITAHLLAAGSGLIVVACNAASSAALHHLRGLHPGVPFVGMEPAVKPAALHTASGVVGVLTTRATFQGDLFASVVDRFASGVAVRAVVCDGWVELVERGQISGQEAEEAVRRHVEPLIEAGADTLVLGCTHFPFLGPMIRTVAGPGVSVVDPGPAVARQTQRLAIELGLTKGSGAIRFDVTGPAGGVAELASRLAGFEVSPTTVTLGTDE